MPKAARHAEIDAVETARVAWAARVTGAWRKSVEAVVEAGIDLGLRLDDVERLGLASERVDLDRRKEAAQRERLNINGATALEIDFLMGGFRVELNA
jgi:hypothetical protein